MPKNCESCRFFLDKDAVFMEKVNPPAFEPIESGVVYHCRPVPIGECHRKAHPGFKSWPSTEKTDWCGDFESGRYQEEYADA